MKFFVSMVLIALLSFAACLYMPWWSIAIAAFIVSVLIYQKPWMSFVAGFAALFVLWTLMALYISGKNDDVLAHKISLMILRSDSPVGLALFTGIVGALVAGFASLAGSYLRKIYNSFQLAPQRKNAETAPEMTPVDSTAN